jgi:hypothetical protein
MEVGNPNSGEIGIGFATTPELVAAGFQRGWETAYRAPDGAVIDIDVFEFASPSGPAAVTTAFRAHLTRGYRQFAIPAVTNATAEIGTSPEGRTAVASAFGHDRFLVVLIVGGQPGLHDYESVFDQLAQRQLANLR